MEKSLSHESGNHVKFLIKTKLNQKWLASPPIPTLSWCCYWHREHRFNLSFGSRPGRTPVGPEQTGWQKEGESGRAGAPLNLWISVSEKRAHRSERNVSFLCLLHLVPLGGRLHLWETARAASGQGDLVRQSDGRLWAGDSGGFAAV